MVQVMGNTHSAISAGDLQEYLESNKISEIVQEAVNALSKERPEKPLAFLVREPLCNALSTFAK